MRVLLVDNDSEMRGAVCALLEVEGHQVLEASRGQEALDLGESRGVDLLISNLRMPSMDGIEVADRLSERAVEIGHPIAVVLQSSDSDYPGLRQRVLAGGMAFLRQPFSAAELAEEIDSAFARKATLARRVAERLRLRAIDESAAAAEVPVWEPVPSPAPASARVDEQALIAAAARTRWLPPLWQLAASVLLVLAAGGAFHSLLREPPQLPAPPATTIRRGMAIEVVEPEGLIAALPAAFVWRRADGSNPYRVTVRAIDDRILWSGSVDGTRLEAPPELTAALHPAVSYTWSVEALDPHGKPLARSSHIRFRIAPSAASADERP